MIYSLYPVLKEAIWGGEKLKETYGKESPLPRIAESWELSCHPDGVSSIGVAGFDGSGPVPLTEFIRIRGKAEVLGSRPAAFPSFPVLIKLIDAAKDLSIQVHPDDRYAMRVEGASGKTEMWYIIDCEEDASILYGFNRPVSQEEVRSAALDGTLPTLCNRVPVHKGDVFWINAGTLHAIGGGITLAEIQQNSDLTYRLYDYGRLGADGKPRELHLDKALDVLKLEKPARMGPIGRKEYHQGYTRTLLGSCHYFTVSEIDLTGEYMGFATPLSFHCLTVADGEVIIENEGQRAEGKKGDSFLIPAGAGVYCLRGRGKTLITTV